MFSRKTERFENIEREQDELSGLRLQLPGAPQWEQLRSGITTKLESEENSMGVLGRYVAGQRWPLRLAISLAVVALLVVASLILPFVRGTEHAPKLLAYSGGYVLVYDFGAVRPGEALHEQGAAIVHKWKAAQEGEIELALGEDIIDGKLLITVSLIGATQEQVDELVEALAVLPELPAATVSEASWYQVEEVEARDRGELFLYEFEHGFYFPRGTTGEQIEQALRDYLIERDGACEVEINVDVEWGSRGASVSITTS